MKFDLITNDRIVDAMTAFADFRSYRDKCHDHGVSWATEDRKSAGFAITIWEKARNADALIQKAGIEGIKADTWLWQHAVERHLALGNYEGYNVEHINSLLGKEAA